MAFFKPKPNLADHERARVEFHLQEIAESIGFERFTLPVQRVDQMMDFQGQTPEQIVSAVAKHLSHDLAGFQVEVAVEPQEKCGGGG